MEPSKRHNWRQLPDAWMPSAFLVDRFTLRCRDCGVALVVERKEGMSWYDSWDLEKMLDLKKISEDCNFEICRSIMES